MKELVKVIAVSLVDHPDEIVVTEKETENSIILELHVAPDDNPHCCQGSSFP